MKLSTATNDSPTRQAFMQRQEYANNYPAGIRNHRKIDFWYNEILFGRVDQEGNIVYPSEAFLKQLDSGEGTYFVLDFVASAYQAFRDSMLAQESQNHFINLDGTPFEDRFEPTKGWISINTNYDVYIRDYYESFLLPFLADPSREGEIINFDDFIVAFTRLIDRTSLAAPFTKTEYIVSKYSSPLVSGLMVEFAEKAHGDDPKKILDFVNNINFELYREIASQHGFAVDLNAPWRLIADVGSVVMGKAMAQQGVDLNSVFDTYYYQSSLFDIPNLKIHLYNFYNSFVRAFPTTRSSTVAMKNGQSMSLTSARPRVIMSEDEYGRRYTNAFWMRLYLYIRAQETNRDWDQYKFDHTARRAVDFLKYSGEMPALKFINKEVKRAPGEYLQTEEYRRGVFGFKRKRE